MTKNQRRFSADSQSPTPRSRGRGLDARVLALLVVLALGVGWLVYSNGSRAASTLLPAASGSMAAGTSTGGTATNTAASKTTTSKITPTKTTPPKSTPPAKTDPVSGLAWVDLAALPKQASDTMRVIKAGPPYSAYKDGATFGNNERLLPLKPGSYYHEFTVVTPGSSDRGARRIITGGPAYGTTNGEYYYTDDHYASYRRIRP